MAMHNPPHPGEFIIQVYLEPNNLSALFCGVSEYPSLPVFHSKEIGWSLLISIVLPILGCALPMFAPQPPVVGLPVKMLPIAPGAGICPT